MKICEKVGKSRNIVFFQWFVTPEGRKVSSLKWRVRSHLARWKMKNCMPLWLETRFYMNKTHQVRIIFGNCDIEKIYVLVMRNTFRRKYKTHQLRTTFGSCHVEKVQAVVARSTFWNQNIKEMPYLNHFWKLRCWKKYTSLWREPQFDFKMLKY